MATKKTGKARAFIELGGVLVDIARIEKVQTAGSRQDELTEIKLKKESDDEYTHSGKDSIVVPERLRWRLSRAEFMGVLNQAQSWLVRTGHSQPVVVQIEAAGQGLAAVNPMRLCDYKPGTKFPEPPI